VGRSDIPPVRAQRGCPQ